MCWETVEGWETASSPANPQNKWQHNALCEPSPDTEPKSGELVALRWQLTKTLPTQFTFTSTTTGHTTQTGVKVAQPHTQKQTQEG